MKGLGVAVTSFVLVVAATAVTLVIVGYSFGLFNVYNVNNAVTQAGVAYLTGNNGHYTLKVILNNIASHQYTVTGVSIQGVPASSVGGQLNVLPSTMATYTLDVSVQGLSLEPGSTVSVVLALSNGEAVHIAAIYQG
jgi:hypothetical protein